MGKVELRCIKRNKPLLKINNDMKPINYIVCMCFINKFAFIHSLLLEEDVVTDHEAWQQLPTICGVSKPARRIVGGRRAFLGQFPWMARLGYLNEDGNETSFQCGAGLISKWHVLSASHCVLPELVIVRLGEYNEITVQDCDDDDGTCAPPVQDIEPSYILSHPKYDAVTAYNDIALIWLKSEVQFNDFVRPICLPRGQVLRKDFTLKMATVAGWGRAHPHRKINSFDDLHHVTITIRDKCACNEFYPFRKIAQGQICAGEANGDDSCTGDSGGPLVKLINDDWQFKTYMIGVVSYGLAQCGEGPSVYSDVIHHMKWILDSLRNVENLKSYQPSTDATTKKEFSFEKRLKTPTIVPRVDVKRPAPKSVPNNSTITTGKRQKDVRRTKGRGKAREEGRSKRGMKCPARSQRFFLNGGRRNLRSRDSARRTCFL